MPITLPFDIGIQNVKDSTVFVSPNGLLSLFAASTESENEDLPDPSLPRISILPFWDDLYFTDISHGIFYEVYPSTMGGREVTFEWLGYSRQSFGSFHFAATFYETLPNLLDFKYYTTGDKGASATIGAQRFDEGYYSPKWSFNMPDAVPDGTILTLDSQQSSEFTRATFDNTACGKQPIGPEP